MKKGLKQVNTILNNETKIKVAFTRYKNFIICLQILNLTNKSLLLKKIKLYVR